MRQQAATATTGFPEVSNSKLAMFVSAGEASPEGSDCYNLLLTNLQADLYLMPHSAESGKISTVSTERNNIFATAVSEPGASLTWSGEPTGAASQFAVGYVVESRVTTGQSVLISEHENVLPFLRIVPDRGYELSTADQVDEVLNQGISELRLMVSAIARGAVLQGSPQLEQLLDLALAEEGTPADIDQWARRLADNVTDLDD